MVFEDFGIFGNFGSRFHPEGVPVDPQRGNAKSLS